MSGLVIASCGRRDALDVLGRWLPTCGSSLATLFQIRRCEEGGDLSSHELATFRQNPWFGTVLPLGMDSPRHDTP